jgi:xylulose-5-phosphate/fructose-6-phosphate phosphoketolase
VCCVVGDGEVETGPLATSWHSNKFLDPARDGAVLPILHLNGYKIANPTVLARIPDEELTALLEGYGYWPYIVAGEDPAAVHQLMAATLGLVVEQIQARPGWRCRTARSRTGSGPRPSPARPSGPRGRGCGR